MRWRERLRDMILAGGALAAGACADRGTDAADHGGSSYCCNTSTDPCCTCAGPDAAQDPVNCSRKTACEAEGGAWIFDVAVNSSRCSTPGEAAPADDVSDAAPSDVVDSEVPSDVIPMACCNANYDPCCSCYGPDAALETTSFPDECASERACRAEGGTFDIGTTSRPDGSLLGPHCAWAVPADGGDAGD
jgi:hypothetical protein